MRATIWLDKDQVARHISYTPCVGRGAHAAGGAWTSSQSPTEPESLQWKLVGRGAEGVGADSNHDHRHYLQHREHVSGPRSASPSG